MPGLKVSVNNGIQIEYGSLRYILDPRSAVTADYTFVSHAHIDHMHQPAKGTKVISSRETKDLAYARGFDLGEILDGTDVANLLDSGHILGSRAIMIGDDLLYTGDAAGRERAFLGRCKTKRARILITETTYGSPEYIFPSTAKIVKEVNTLLGEAFDKGKPVILMGYPLGKAQLLCYFFSSWSPLYIHEDVAKINEVHRRHGVELKKGRRIYSPTKKDEDFPPGPWAMVAPLMSGRSKLMSHLKERRGAILVAFSGWAIDPSYRHGLAVDYAFPLSDHCDYAELMKLVQDVSPEQVYTTHGFAPAFARDLKHLGFNARPLSSYQSSLFDYVKAG